ncbi:MAG: hypothetical protein RI580_10865 [Halothece sp. Uz-M2-17]|nr:hypothetical protein [Halothece sp. Uz-M2-17]
MNYYSWGSWLFLLGSALFTLDAFLLNLNQLTWRSLVYLLGCILFTVGCVCFVVDAIRQ